MPICYAVQNQKRYDKESGSYVDKFDLSPAEEYGELKFLLSPTASPFRPDAIMPDIWFGLRHFTEDDYLLLIGNPVLIGLCVAVAADFSGGRIQLLQWSGKEGRYLPVQVNQVFDEPA